MTYAAGKQRLIDELLRSADAQESGRIQEIDGSFDQLEECILNNPDPEFDRLRTAPEFWAGWIDAGNHDWLFYEGIEASDWPRLARLIAEDLKADRETSDERIKKHFDYRLREKRTGIWKCLARMLTEKIKKQKTSG